MILFNMHDSTRCLYTKTLHYVNNKTVQLQFEIIYVKLCQEKMRYSLSMICSHHKKKKKNILKVNSSMKMLNKKIVQSVILRGKK